MKKRSKVLDYGTRVSSWMYIKLKLDMIEKRGIDIGN
jgi:hypothetical protein